MKEGCSGVYKAEVEWNSWKVLRVIMSGTLKTHGRG